jgi:hypothetical protein
MQKLIIAVLCLFASSVMGQTNYKTIMYRQKRDSVRKEINLHIQKGKVLNKFGDLLTATTFASAILSQYVGERTPRTTIFLPLGIGISALATYALADRQEQKAQEKRIKFICKF